MADRYAFDIKPFPAISLLAVMLLGAACVNDVEFATQTGLSADTVLLNGKIITVDSQDSIAEAVAIRDGKIVAVGSNQSVRGLMGETTLAIDLKGLTATPGLIDAHCHFAAGGFRELYHLDLSYPAIRTIGDVVEKIKEKVETSEPGAWIFGTGWDEGKLEELRYIYASDIDSVSPQNPVFLEHTMGHYGTANTVALKQAGVARHTSDPPGGTIDRSADGTPTGVLKETAQQLVKRLIPPMTRQQAEEGIVHLVKGFHSEGMTAAKEAGIGQETWDAYQNVLHRGQLKIRMFVLWEGGETVEDAQGMIEQVADFTKPYVSTGDDRLISGGIKLYMDGSGGARTAWLHEDWNKNYRETDTGNTGYPAIEPEEFRKMVKLYHDAGLHLGVHAIGDRAIDWLMDSYAEALRANPIEGLRHSIIHSNIPTDRALEIMASMQAEYDAGYPETEAVHLWWIGDTYAGNFGPPRSLKLKPLKTFLERNIQWAAASDYYVVPYPARYGIWAQMVREPLLGVYGEHPFGDEESVSVRDSLRAYTIWGAHQLFMEDKIGSIEIGKLADIAIWDRDLYTVTAAEIKEMKCQMTLFQGEIVYQAEDTPLTPITSGRMEE